jgi:hypothetical protein
MKPITSRLAHVASSIFFPFYLLRKKTRVVIVMLIIAAVFTSCYQHFYRTHTTTPADNDALKRLQNSNKFFILHFNNNKVFALNQVTVNNNKMEADLAALPPEHSKYLNPKIDRPNRVKKTDKPDALTEIHLYYPQDAIADQTHVSIPLSSLNRMDIYEFDRQTTRNNHILSSVGIGLVGGAVIVLVAFAIACNCPQVYINNDGQYEFKSGVYSGAVYSTLERQDFLPLEGIKPMNDKYQFRIGNVENEEQFINQVQLLKADHPADVKVLADRHGKILSYKDPLAPATAIYDDTKDVTQELKHTDAQYYSFDSKADNNGFSSVTLSFNRSGKETHGKLLVHAGNSKWSGYLYKEFSSLFGDGYEKWRKQQEQAVTTDAQKWQLEQGLPLKVFVETNNGWQYVDHFALTGNTSSRDMIMDIDLSAVKSEKVNIRIESAFQFWDLDMAAMDFSEDIPVTTTILNPLVATKGDGISNIDELLQQDKKYTHLTGHDFVNIEFAAVEPKAGNNVSLFLISSGYYHSQYKFEGKADVQSLLQFREKGTFDKFSRKKYAVVQEAFAKAMKQSDNRKN